MRRRSRFGPSVSAAGASIAVASLLLPAPARADVSSEAPQQEARPWLLGGPRGSFSEPLVSERPSFSTSPDATPAGRINAELGFELARDDRGGPEHESVTLPAALLRLGLAEHLEARLGWIGFSAQREAGSERDVVADPTLGFKWQLNAGGAHLPRTGLIFEVGLPIGEGTGSQEPAFTAALAWRQSLVDGLALFGTSTLGRASEDGEDVFASTHAAGLSCSVTPRWSAYAEYFTTLDEDARDTHTLDVGLAFLLTSSVQLDVYGGAGLDAGARDGFVGAGIAWRM